MSAGSATEGSGRPAVLPSVLDLVEVHEVEEPEGVLPEVHRAAGGIDQRDVAGALERLDLAGLGEALEADLLTGAGDEVVRQRRAAAGLAR